MLALSYAIDKAYAYDERWLALRVCLSMSMRVCVVYMCMCDLCPLQPAGLLALSYAIDKAYAYDERWLACVCVSVSVHLCFWCRWVCLWCVCVCVCVCVYMFLYVFFGVGGCVFLCVYVREGGGREREGDRVCVG